MKTIVLKTGETAIVPTDSEMQILNLALKQFNQTLPIKGESHDG